MSNQLTSDELESLQRYMPPGWREQVELPLTPDEAADCVSHLQALLLAAGTYFPRAVLVDDCEERVCRGEFRYGTALFADVSGFTTMTERFSRELGREGAEGITSIVNSVLEAMNGIAMRYGGDLLQFAGDAALSFYQGDEHAGRACRAAWEMQRAMREQFAHVETELGEFPLRISIGLGSGQIFAASLGTPDSVEYAVMGPALASMGHAEHTAQAGQVFIDRATRELAGDSITVASGDKDLFELLESKPRPSAIERPNLRIAAPDDTPHAALRWLLARLNVLTPYLTPGLLEKLIPTPEVITVESELRWVTTLFTDLRGVDELVEFLGPEREELLTEVVNRHFLAVRNVVERYEGVLHKVGAGPSGPHLLITFGAPKSHADDPERAVRVGLEMQEALVEVNQEIESLIGDAPDLEPDASDRNGRRYPHPLLRQAMGITTGFVFAGSVGSTRRWEYTVMGDLVNLSARLMAAAADGEVLVADNTVRHLGERFELHPREPMRVKGKSEPIPYSQATGLTQLPSLLGTAEGRIVGRGAELETAQGLLDGVAKGTGSMLAICGDAGMGKTRLTQEIAQRAQRQGMQVIVGSCLSYGGDIPYLPWVDVLRALLGVAAGDRSLQLQQLTRGLAAAGLTGWEALVAEPLDLEAEETELTASLDPRLRQQRLFDIVLELLERHTRTQPLLLVIDDIHWTDPTSLELLDYVARNVASFPAVMLILYRPRDWLEGHWRHLKHAAEVVLEELPEMATEELVAELLGVDDAPEQLVELVVGKAQGNPFFTGEVVRALIDAEVLKQENGRWELVADPDQAGVPDTIHGVIQSRIDRLEETARRVLQVASVIGRIFSTPVLNGVYPYDDIDGTLPRRLSQLGALGLVMMEVEEKLDPEQRYLFRHALTQDVAYEGLSYARRRDLHRRVGTFVETEGWEAVSERLGFLAYHFFQGRAWGKALEHSLAAGRKAQREYANEVAIAHFERALQAATELDEPCEDERLETHETLGEVMAIVGRYDEALEHLEAARALVEAQQSSLERARRLADLLAKTARACEAKGDYDVALKWLEKGLALPDVSETLEGARIHLNFAAVFYRQGRLTQSIEACKQGLHIAEEVGGPGGRRIVAHARYQLGNNLVRLGALSDAVENCKQSLFLYGELGDLLGQLQAHNNLAMAYHHQDAWGLAAEHYRAAREIVGQIGYAEGQAMVATNLGEIYLRQGDLDAAKEQYQAALDVVERLGMLYGVALLHNNLGAAHAQGEEWDEAARHLEQSLALFQEIGSEDFLAELFRHRAEVVLGQGQLDEALTHANRSLSYAQTHDMRLEEGVTWRVLGRVHRERGALELAEESLARALEIAQEADKRHEIALTRLELARLRLQQGLEDEGRELVQQAALVFEELGARLDLEEAEKLLGVGD